MNYFPGEVIVRVYIAFGVVHFSKRGINEMEPSIEVY